MSNLNNNTTQLELLLQKVNQLPEAGGSAEPILQDKTVTPTTSKQTITADSGYDGLDTVTVNAMPTAAQATPSITIDTSTGLITATATQTEGYVPGGTTSDTEQLTVQAAQTITPGTSNKTIAAGIYLTGTQTIKGDANLVPANIVSGKSIFDIAGTAKIGEDTSDATATSEDIMLGETSYGPDGKITGTFTIDEELSTQDDLITQIQVALQNKAAAPEVVLQTKTVTPTTSVQNVAPDDGYGGLSKVIVEAIPSAYIKPTATKGAATYTPGTSDQIIASGTYLTGVQTIKGDANLTAENIAEGVSIFGVAGTHSGGSGGESSEIFDSILNGTIASYTNNTLSIARDGLFMNCSNLSTVSMPSCTQIKQYAFNNCKKLTSVNFPACTTVGTNAFALCTSITTASFPVCTKVEMSGFAQCSKLTDVNLPVCSSLANYAFARCSALTNIDLPACQQLGTLAFSECYSLATASLPMAVKISNSAFAKCTRLTSLYLMGSSVCQLAHSNAFTSTPIGGYSTSAGAYGKIYVPASLLTSYQTATNWTYYSSRFVGI